MSNDDDSIKVVTGGEELKTVTGSVIVQPKATSAIKEAADKYRQRIISLRDAMTDCYFELGKCLYKIRKDALYHHWGYKSFEEYVDEEVSFEIRKATHLIRIWQYFGIELSENPEVLNRVRALGWTKASHLVGVVDGVNVEQWVALAEHNTTRRVSEEARTAKELRESGEVRGSVTPLIVETKRRQEQESAHQTYPSKEVGSDTVQVKGGSGYTGDKSPRDPLAYEMSKDPLTGGDVIDTSGEMVVQGPRLGADPAAPDDRQRWSILVTRDQRENIREALKVAAELADDKANGDAEGFLCDYVATGFMAFHNTYVRESKTRRKEAFISAMLLSVERVLGVDLIALKHGTDEIVFGDKTVERLEG